MTNSSLTSRLAAVAPPNTGQRSEEPPVPIEVRVMALNGLLERIQAQYQFMEGRQNELISKAAMVTGALIAIAGTAYNVPSLKLLLPFVPGLGFASVYIAWVVSDYLKDLTEAAINDGAAAERALDALVPLPTKPFCAMGSPYASARSLDRMKAALIVMALIWAFVGIFEQVR